MASGIWIAIRMTTIIALFFSGESNALEQKLEKVCRHIMSAGRIRPICGLLYQAASIGRITKIENRAGGPAAGIEGAARVQAAGYGRMLAPGGLGGRYARV